MSKTIGVISIKGGVGKTTVSSAIASGLVNHYGKKVLLVDANYSAPNLGLHMDIVEPVKTIHDVLAGKSRMIGAIHNRFGVDVIPGSYNYNNRINVLKLNDRLKSVKDKYDFIIIDSSPSLNEEMLSTILASDALFVVTTADYPTLSCTLRASLLARQRGKPISGIILNKLRDEKYEIPFENIQESTGIPVVAKLNDDDVALRALYNRIPISVYNRKSKFSKEIEKLNAALTNSQKNEGFFKRAFFRTKPEEINRQILREDFYRRIFRD